MHEYLWVADVYLCVVGLVVAGSQYEQYECMDTKQQTMVRGLCSLQDKPKVETQPCNEHSCHYAYRYLHRWEQAQGGN